MKREAKYLSVIVVLTGLASLVATMDGVRIWTSLLALGILLLVTVTVDLRSSTITLSPGVVFSVFFAIFFLIRPIYLLLFPQPDIRFLRHSPNSYSMENTIEVAIVLALLAYSVFFIAYFAIKLGANRVTMRIYSGSDAPLRTRRWLLFIALLFTLISLLSFYKLTLLNEGSYVLLGSKQELSRGHTVLYWLSWLINDAFLISLAVWSNRCSHKRALFLTGLGLLAGLVNLSLGFRENIILLLIASIVIWEITNSRRVNVRKLVALGLIIVVITLSFALYRQAVSGSDALNLDLISRLTSDLNPFDGYVSTISTIPYERDYFYGQTMMDIFLYAVPRDFSPDKPDYLGPLRLTNILYPNLAAANITITTTILGELYSNFGVAGMLIGLGFVGSLLGWIGSRRFKYSILKILLFAIFVGCLSRLVRTGVYGTVHLYLMHVLPLIVAYLGYRLIRISYQKEQKTWH
ncbi:MAG: O-antigen polymerase [Thermoanaerobacterales bacterium]|nr:O-antigen polymerase [Thermoanaerobacterales bacterium]